MTSSVGRLLMTKRSGPVGAAISKRPSDIRRIQALPQSAPRWRRAGAHEIRRAKVARHPYLVVYAVLEEQLVVLAIAHTRKSPGYWRERVEK